MRPSVPKNAVDARLGLTYDHGRSDTGFDVFTPTGNTAALATVAAEVGIAPALTPAQLRAVILDCGIYDVRDIRSAPGIGGWGFRIALWAYLGAKDWSPTAGAKQMTTLTEVTPDFPTTWISGGNADPLTPRQSKAFAARLESLGVDVTPVFYPDDHEPALPHEYQFHLKLADAREALQSTLDFLQRVTDGSSSATLN